MITVMDDPMMASFISEVALERREAWRKEELMNTLRSFTHIRWHGFCREYDSAPNVEGVHRNGMSVRQGFVSGNQTLRIFKNPSENVVAVRNSFNDE